MLSIIIPAYNAERLIATTFNDYAVYFSTEYHQDFEIIVIVNGCTDRTSEIVLEHCAKFPQVTSKQFEKKLGKGGALIEGFKIARGDILAFVDVDGATRPEELHKLIKGLGASDGAIGSRWLTGSNMLVKQPLPRRIASRGFNLLVKLLFSLPFKDTQCGAKVFKKHAIDEVLARLQTTNFAFDVELLYRLKKGGYKVDEVPIIWEDRLGSTLNLKRAVPTMFLAVLRLRILDSPLKRLARVPLWGYVYKKLK